MKKVILITLLLFVLFGCVERGPKRAEIFSMERLIAQNCPSHCYIKSIVSELEIEKIMKFGVGITNHGDDYDWIDLGIQIYPQNYEPDGQVEAYGFRLGPDDERILYDTIYTSDYRYSNDELYIDVYDYHYGYVYGNVVSLSFWDDTEVIYNISDITLNGKETKLALWCVILPVGTEFHRSDLIIEWND